MIVGPENRTVLSNDTFLRVNLIGDYAGYSSIPSFEDLYLVIPRQVRCKIRMFNLVRLFYLNNSTNHGSVTKSYRKI